MSELKGVLNARDTLFGSLNLGVEYYRGEQGLQGDSGVYVGAEQPTNEDVNVWIEPVVDEVDVVATETFVEEAIASKGYMTEEQVRALIAELVGGGV